MSEHLSNAEGRLLDLLRAGAVPSDLLSDAVEEFIRRRSEEGEDLVLGPFLVAAGLVSVRTVQDLLAGGDAPGQRGAQVPVELPALPQTRGEGSESARSGGRSTGRSRRPARSSGREKRPSRSTRTRRAESEGARGTGSHGARGTGARGTGARRAESEGARGTGARGTGARGTGSHARSSGKRRRSARNAPLPESEEEEGRTARFLPEDLAAASQGKSDRLQPVAFDERTRGFDPEALAASSRQTKTRRAPLLLPALVAGALVVVVCGYVALRESDEVEPLPPPPPSATPEANPSQPDLATGSPGPQPSPSASPFDLAGSLSRLAKAASARELAEDYAGALALYREAPPKVRAVARQALEVQERRFEGLKRFKVAADAAKSVLEALEVGTPNVASRRKRETTMAAAEGLLAGATAEQAQSPAALRLLATLKSLTAVAEQGPKAPGHDPRPEPAERTEAFAAGARQGAKIVAATQARIREGRQRAAARHTAAAERVKERSKQAPITTEIEGIAFKEALVSAYTSEGFSLRSDGQDVAFEWASIVASDPDLALRVRRMALADDDALDQLEFGRWCLVNRLWEDAKDAFRRAVLLEARLKSRVPDVGRIARASQVFRGKVQRTGSSLELSYDFHLPAHNADWTLGSGAKGGVDTERQAYVIRGRGMSLAALREVGWERTLLIRGVALTAARARSLVGVTFLAGKPEEVSYLVGIDARAKAILLLKRHNKKLTVVERKPYRIGKEAILTLACGGDRLEARVDNETQFRAPIPAEWGRTRVLFGGSLERDGEAAFTNLSLSGQARRDWMRKAFGAFEDHLRAYLARTDELELFSRPTRRAPIRTLSAEDEWGLKGVSEQAKAEDKRGRIKLALGKPLDLLSASNTFQRAVEISPSFAGARYRRGLALERLGRADLALKELQRAQVDSPHFYEAQAAEARILARDGHLADALELVSEALAERPDHPAALSAKALIHFRRGELEATQELLDLALALDPWDDEIRAFRRNVTNVRRGPPWERTFREETVNYRVLTDISQARGRDYADQLETIREFYAEVFGVEGQVRAQRASVLIFDTEEGFQAYADLTTDDRVESLLGYYLPRYDQLLLYEGRDDASGLATRRVLYHEAFHQFIYPLIPDLPYWVNEGLADYFSATVIEGGTVVSRGGALSARLRDLRRFVSERGRPLSPSGLIRETPSEFYSGPVAVKYAQAWTMVHFFLHGEASDYTDRFQRYLATLRQGGTSTEGYEAAFAGMDWKAFERDWWAHVKGL